MKRRLICDDAIPYIAGRLENDFDVTYLEGNKINSDDVKEAEALLVRTRTKCDKALLEGSKVKIVATATIGMDHYNLKEMSELGIEAKNAPGCNAPAVAQYVWSTLLRSGFDLKNDILGLVGKGNVGSVVADFGRKLGAQILVCDPPRQERGESDEEYLSLEEIAGRCDAITFHTPLTREGRHATYHLGGKEIIDKLKPGAILVNAARGGVVDEEAVIEAIDGKGLKAVIDTWNGEPGHINKILLGKAAIASPHIAGYSRQGKERATRMVLEALEEKFGIKLNKEGLEGAYKAPEEISAKGIIQSYDPACEMEKMLRDPDNFEEIRETYPLREEYSESHS